MTLRWSALALLLAIAGALALRLPRLDTRPLHNDEAVNAVKVNELWQHGRYAYDPHEYHGPTLHYFSLPFFWLSGVRSSDQLTDTQLRLAPVACGVGLILLLILFVDGLGRHAVAWAALFTAVSPAMVFYSRYFIHEMFLVFFTTLTIGAGWRYFQTRHARWAVTAGVGAGLMWATKETFVLAMAAMAAATAAVIFRHKSNPQPHYDAPPNDGAVVGTVTISKASYFRHLAFAVLAALTVWLLLFTSLFRNWQGLADSVLTYLPWLNRAGGNSPHIHPWSFYLERLAWFHPARSPVWSEGLILALAAAGAGVSWLGKTTPLHRFLTLYTIGLTVIYCVISYKTPWCLLGFYQGMLVLAGIGAAALVNSFRTGVLKLTSVAILAILAGQLTWQAWRASFQYPADRRNPYVYAQTVPDILNLVRKAEGIARVAAEGHDTVVKVVAPGSEYWPLPWYLRRFNYIGWFDQLPPDPFAPIVIVAAKLDARLDEKSDKRWIMAGLSELRPGVFFELYVELELWKQYVATLPREVD